MVCLTNSSPLVFGRCTRNRRYLDCRASSEEPSASRSFLSILCPLLKAFSSSDLRAAKPRWFEVSTSGLASISRLPYGSNPQEEMAVREDPVQPIRIYEFEACPFCRRVREAVTDLDLTVDVYPCPKDALSTRQDVMKIGGKEQFPFLIDENNETHLYESETIVRHLYKNYGMGNEPPVGLLETTPLTGWMPTVFRIGRGIVRYPKSTITKDSSLKLLELYNYENNQFSRLVREVLCELELPYRCISCGKGSKNRGSLQNLQGNTRVPYLIDPNTGSKISDSDKIIQYLIETYTTS